MGGILYPPRNAAPEAASPGHRGPLLRYGEINTSFYGTSSLPRRSSGSAPRKRSIPTSCSPPELHRSFTLNPMAVIEPTSAASIRPNDEDEALAEKASKRWQEKESWARCPSSFRFFSRILPLPRVSGEAAAPVHRISAGGRSPPRQLGRSQHDQRFHAEKCRLLQYRSTPDRPISCAHRARDFPVGYVRLHGRNYDQWFEAEAGADRYNYLYSEDELAGWKERIGRIAQKAEVTYVVANNHFEVKPELTRCN